MKHILHIFRYILPVVTALAVISCIHDELEAIPVGTQQEGTAEVSFMADLPNVIEVSTRGEVGLVPENTISDIYVLVFKTSGNKDLVYKAKGRNLEITSTPDNNRATFKATLPVGSEYTFMVLANAESKLGGIAVGASTAKTKADVLKLTQTLDAGSKWDSTSPPIPMWGEQNLTLAASSAPVFVLTRMLARVNVEFKPKEVNGTTLNNFRLASVRYYNYNTAGTLVAAEENYTVDGTNVTATDPTIPVTPGTRLGEALIYTDGDIADKKSCKNKIYIFEAAHNGKTYNTPPGNNAWINNPCLVVGGQYSPDNGSTWGGVTYYRIDFIRKDLTSQDNPADVWLSVLRNFSYNVTITQVSGDGFDDPEVALKSAPINMEANVLDWREGGMAEIVFDGVFYLSVSQDEFVFQRNGSDVKSDENTVFIKTDYVYNNDKNSSKSGWTVDRYENINGMEMSESEQWLTLVPASGKPDIRTEAYFTYKTNTELTNREAYVWIAAGRLRYRIHVVQRVTSLDIVDPDDSDAAITEIRFVVPRTGSYTAEPRHFKVLWTPIERNVRITSETAQSRNPFEPVWLDPNPETGQGWQIIGGAGTKLYTVQPPTVTNEQLKIDPFYERETTYYFNVDNSTDSEKKGILLHQIYYNIIVDTYNYSLDGKTYSINVRSNTDWKITKIEEWLYNSDPATLQLSSPIMLQLSTYDNLKVGSTGGPNLSGESVSFTVVNKEVAAHQDKWGTIWVTFESPDGKFPPQRVPIYFSQSNLTLLGLGYARDVRTFNVAFPSTYHLQGANRMLTSPVNFGDINESVVKVKDFKIVGYNCQGLSGAATGGPADDANWCRGSFKKWLNKHNPAIIVITYSMQLIEEEVALLKQYLENGGAAILYYGGEAQSEADLRILIRGLFGNLLFSNSDCIKSSPSAVYKLSSGPEYASDPILNGPFGDIRGKYWGTHLSRCAVRTSVVGDEVHILSRTDSRVHGSDESNGFVNIFRHKTLNLLWIGNGMGTSSYYPYYGSTEPYHDPNRNSEVDFSPVVRTGFGYSPFYDVYNSFLFCNAIAWAISVTKHQPPAGGY